jgi:hypothetical protein
MQTICMMGSKKVLLAIILTAALIPITFFSLYLYWKAHSPLLAFRTASDQVSALERMAGRYEEALKADTMGGKTPEETLSLFVAALEKGDVELAAQYFALESNESSLDYLTRAKWRLGLAEVEKNGQLEELASAVRTMEMSSRNLGTNDAVEYVLYKDDVVERAMMLVRNKATGVWKIESL